MNTKEMLRALADGKKISCINPNVDFKYFYLNDAGKVICNDGILISTIGNYGPYSIYEEPKPKKTVWQWRFRVRNAAGNFEGDWAISGYMRTKKEAYMHYHLDQYEKHAGPFEVEE